jgi:hypothetical protein
LSRRASRRISFHSRSRTWSYLGAVVRTIAGVRVQNHQSTTAAAPLVFPWELADGASTLYGGSISPRAIRSCPGVNLNLSSCQANRPGSLTYSA